MGLDEDRAHVRVQPGGEQEGGHLEGLVLQPRGVVLNRERVEVDNAEERVVLVLIRRPVADRPDVVAEVDLTGGLDARQDPGHPVDGMRGATGGPR